MPRLLSLVLLLPALSFAAEPIRLAAPGLTGVGVTPELTSFYSEHLAQQLAFQGVRVVTAREIAAVLGYERQKQLTGCADSSCMVDLSGTLGADGLVIGDVARVGQGLHFTLKVVDVQTGKRLAGFSAKVEGEDLVLETLSRGAQVLAQEVSQKLGRPLMAVSGNTEELQAGPRRYAWMPAAGGIAFGAAGTAFMLLARSNYTRLTTGTAGVMRGEEADRLRQQGWTYQTMGLTGVGLGIAGLGAGALLYALGGASSTVQTGVSLAPNEGSVTVTWVFP